MLKLFKKKQKPEVEKRTILYKVNTNDNVISCKASVEDERDLAYRFTNVLDSGGWFYVVTTDNKRIVLREEDVDSIVIIGEDE